MFPHMLTNNPKKYHCDWHSSEGTAEPNVLINTGMLSVAGAGLSPAWPGSFVLTMLFTSSLSFARVCHKDLNASLSAPISSTAFEALDITYFTAFSSLFPAEGPNEMAEETLLLHIVATKGFTTFT